MKTKAPRMNVSPRFSLRLALALAVAALIALCPLATRANTIALDFTGGDATLADGDLTVGWGFTLSSSVLLTDLGLWDGPNLPGGSIGDGFAQSHVVTIWTSTGIQVAQAAIPAGTGTEINNFLYVSISPTMLTAGSYVIGAFFAELADGDTDTFAGSASSVTTASGVMYDGTRSGLGNAFPQGNFFFGSNGAFGPNFQFTAPPTNGVPEASATWSLLLLGVTATFGLKSFVRRPA